MTTAQDRLRTLSSLDCGQRLLELLGDADDVWLVGGAVRDLLLSRTPAELDLVTLRDAPTLAGQIGDVAASHGRFGTATAIAAGCRFDVARARSERYAEPGALPDVQEATLDVDLRRRDFTVNAIAMSMTGELETVEAALDDLSAGRLRVLHDASFTDDPTRLWRLVRYSVRLGFAIEPRTAELAAAAVAAGALKTVSGDRLGAELRLALREPDPLSTLHAAANLGLVEGLSLDPAVIGRSLQLLPAEGRSDLTILGAALSDIAHVQGLGFTSTELATLRRCVEIEPLREGTPSEIAARLRGEPVEAVAIAGATGSARTAEQWLLQWRSIELEIDGDDLIAAGVPQGPEIGERLRKALDRKLDGEIAGRDSELAAALE